MPYSVCVNYNVSSTGCKFVDLAYFGVFLFIFFVTGRHAMQLLFRR